MNLTTYGRKMGAIRTSFCFLTGLRPRDWLPIKAQKFILRVFLNQTMHMYIILTYGIMETTKNLLSLVRFSGLCLFFQLDNYIE